ncbi:hypothetical protein, partial [Enterococcus mundtii]|uniref:hypothetical protein n=1 Tax=Enterococcus mundtii TaxID=53346 RepID=UPI001C38C5CD
LLGYLLIDNSEEKYDSFAKYMYGFIISSVCYSFLSVLKTSYQFGGYKNAIASLGGRLTLDLWSNNFVSATALNGYLSIGLVLLPVIFLSTRNNEITKKYKLLSFFVFLLASWTTIQIHI